MNQPRLVVPALLWTAVVLASGPLAGCIPVTDGAPCQTSANCPTGQACVSEPGGLVCRTGGTGVGGGGGTGGGGGGGGVGGGGGGGTGGGTATAQPGPRLEVGTAGGRLQGGGFTLDAQVGGQSRAPVSSGTTTLGPAAPVVK